MNVQVNRRLSIRLSESTELSSYQRYLQVCRQVAQLEPYHSSGNKAERSPGNRSDLLLQAFKKSKVSIGTDVDSFDLLTTWVQGRHNHKECGTEQAQVEGNSSNRQMESICLICIETITDGPLDSPNRLFPCAHTTCVECWQAYLQSAALSRQSANIRCPAIKCPIQIDLFTPRTLCFTIMKDQQFQMW
jgi:hypothetical protein